METSQLLDGIRDLQDALTHMIQIESNGYSLQQYGVHSLAQALALALLPMLLYLVIDQLTKPRKRRK